MEARPYYRSLMRNMVLIVVVVSIAPLLLTIAIIGHRFETSYREKVTAQLVELVEKHQQNITVFLNEKLSYIRVLANSFSFEQLSNDLFLQNKLALLQDAYEGVFVDLGLVDGHGVQIAYAGAYGLGRVNYSDSEWFRKAMTRPFYVSDVFPGIRKQPHFIVTVRKMWGEDEFILRATIDFEAFNSLVENIRVGKTGSAFIINNEGAFQTKPKSAPILDRELFTDLLAGKSEGSSSSPGEAPNLVQVQSLPLPEGYDNRDISVVRLNHAQREVICVMTPLKSGEWVLAYQQDDADAFSDLYHTRKLTVSIAFLGGIAIVVMAFVLSGRMVKRIEKSDMEKEEMNEQIIEAGRMASVGELAAGVAHEINNPIAIMIEEAGWIGDLLEEEDSKERQNLEEFKRALQQIRTQGERCTEITHKLLSFARKTDPRKQDVQVNELIEEIVSICEQRSRLSSVKIVKHLAPRLPHIYASASEMQQVLLNLINNAIDAIHSGGGVIDITTGFDGRNVFVDVADTGCGIPKAVTGRIFDPFFTTKPVGKGTGLGLSICYGIVRKMGGEITVESVIDAGTTFHIHLPLAQGYKQ